MTPKSICLLTTDSEGDRLGARLAGALREKLARAEAEYGSDLLPLHASLEPSLWGLGGSEMARARIELIGGIQEQQGTTQGSRVFGPRHNYEDVFDFVLSREPHAIVFVGCSKWYGGLACCVENRVNRSRGTFYNWAPLVFHLTRSSRSEQPLSRSVIHIESEDVSRAAEEIVSLLLEQDEHFPLRAHLY
jgi:hypothetical protein